MCAIYLRKNKNILSILDFVIFSSVFDLKHSNTYWKRSEEVMSDVVIFGTEFKD